MYHFISIAKLKAVFKTINSDNNHILVHFQIEINAENQTNNVKFLDYCFENIAVMAISHYICSLW
jgi:hypothetical protein